MASTDPIIEKGSLFFTIESRIIRELGERLVRQGAVAVLELIKNAYDADATRCSIQLSDADLVVHDDGTGMSIHDFRNGWMRIGTSSKEGKTHSPIFHRSITGEKGIGRFAVRFLGKRLEIETVAYDTKRKYRTLLAAQFDWPRFDKEEDLGKVTVPYTLRRAPSDSTSGTKLTISALRSAAAQIDFRAVRTGSVGMVSPYLSLFQPLAKIDSDSLENGQREDAGFSLQIGSQEDNVTENDLGRNVLDRFVLRALLEVKGHTLKLKVWERGAKKPFLNITDKLASAFGDVYADLRFFPQRGGTFNNIGLDGRVARGWVHDNAGVSVFDRRFRVHPYGFPDDDWLGLARDTGKNERHPQSSIAKKFFPMSPDVQGSTKLNYMLRLPRSEQLVGVVEVAAARSHDSRHGLIPAADREGFVNNEAYRSLVDLVRGAVEGLAFVDREVQQREEREKAERTIQQLQDETRYAIEQIESDAGISKGTRNTLIRSLLRSQELSKSSQESSRNREQTLEVMSLLGVIAGFMTHEFGTAIDDLERAKAIIAKLSTKHPELKTEVEHISSRVANLRDFVTYSQGYIRGAAARPEKPFLVRPRIQQVIRVFGKYAEDRDIEVKVEIESDLLAPLVPVSLYNGIALNLFTNALKAVTAKSGKGSREISFRGWDEKAFHILEVSDSGVGLPVAFRDRIFDPLFTTTSTNKDPLGSGMGLGLTLVRRGVEAFGGNISAVDPPPGFSTCLRVELPLQEG